MQQLKEHTPGILLCFLLAVFSSAITMLLPLDIIGAGVLAIIIGMALNPFIIKFASFAKGISFVSKRILKFGIVLMGFSLSFTELMKVGKYSLFIMMFTLLTAFGGGYLLGRLFKMNWKLTSLLSVSTAICGGSAVAAVGPTIEADDKDIAYAISATFIFDIITVIVFPWIGHMLNLGDMGYGLWVGTAVNDTSSVVAAGYAFSDLAGNFAVIVKLTRTLFIIPIVIIFSLINERVSAKSSENKTTKKKINFKKIFPWFILLFLLMVALKSTGIFPPVFVSGASTLSKFLMVMALGAIGLKTNFKEVSKSGFKPMILGFTIDTLVVIVAISVQFFINII